MSELGIENKTGFYCLKCNSVPLIQVLPKSTDLYIFSSCKCHKNLLNFDTFMKYHYKLSLDYSKIENKAIFSEYIDPNPNPYLKNPLKDINLEKIISTFENIKTRISKYSKELKEKLISIYQKKISEIETIYETYQQINTKIEKIINCIIKNYKSSSFNDSNMKNLVYNTGFNLGFQNNTHNINFNNYIPLDNLTKNIINFYKNNFLIAQNEKLENIKTFYNHSKNVNCIIEVKKNIIASCSNDNFIIFYDLINKKSIYKFKAHENGVNWIIKLNENNICSCGNDFYMVIWPSIKEEDLLLVNDNGNGTTNTVEKEIIPVKKILCVENKDKIININNNFICCFGGNNIYLYDLNFDKKLSAKNLAKKITDIYNLQNDENKNIILVSIKDRILFLSIPELEIINEIPGIFSNKNCIAQINKNEIILGNNYYLKLININNFQIKLSIKLDHDLHTLKILNDKTFVICDREGIKRYSLKKFEFLCLIGKIYSYIPPYPNNNYKIEQYNYVYEFEDGRLGVCSSHGNIKIFKLTIG